MSIDLKIQRQMNKFNKVNSLYADTGLTIKDACKEVGICKQTYYTYRNKFNKKNDTELKGGSNLFLPIREQNIILNNKFPMFSIIDAKLEETGICK